LCYLTSHNIWLRDHCQSEAHFHPLTKQRLQNTFDIPEDIHASVVELIPAFVPTQLKVIWAHDSFVSVYDLEWLQLHSYDPVLVTNKSNQLERSLWKPESITAVLPQVEFKTVMDSDKGVAEWTKKIHQFGFCLINNVPIDPKTTEKLVERIAYIRPTHYGGFWDFTADLAMHDTAYTNLYLASHTDGTYWSDTPGLQLFHLLHHDGKGGETMLVDGFAAAKELKERDPIAYEFLSTTKIPAHSAGEENVCITPTMPQPVLTHHSVTGELVQVRWNNDDRSTMDHWQAPEDVDMFYKSIRLWKKILLENEIIYKLTPGTCLMFDNWRVLHGRQAFDGSRRMCGAYINRDDYVSRLRLLNLGRDAVLREL
jgi:trimethyllysine dioxygenase